MTEKAGRQTDCQAEDGHEDGCHGTDSGQGIDADSAADDDDVGDIIELLENIAD